MRILPSLLLPLLLTSCSLQATLTLDPGSTKLAGDFTLSPATKAAWSNLRELDSSLPPDPLDPQLWRHGLGDQARVTATPQGGSVDLDIPDPRRLFPSLKSDDHTWDLTIDRATVRRLLTLTSWGSSPALDSLLPSPETKVTEAEYRDLLVYMLGPGTPESAARVLVDNSTVQLTVVAPGPLVSAEGAASWQGRSAVYRWPLVRALTLERPLRIHLTF